MSSQRQIHPVESPPWLPAAAGRVTTNVVALVIFESVFVGWLLSQRYSPVDAICIPLVTLAGVMLIAVLPAAIRATPGTLRRARAKIHQMTSGPDEEDVA
jgi:hypothetical protein